MYLRRSSHIYLKRRSNLYLQAMTYICADMTYIFAMTYIVAMTYIFEMTYFVLYGASYSCHPP